MSVDLSSSALSRFGCFRDLTAEQRRVLGGRLCGVECRSGEVLFREGDPGGTIYLLASGEMEILIRIPGHDDRCLAVLSPGAVLGEISFLLDKPRSATAAARTTAQLWSFRNDALQEALAGGEVWAQRFLLGAAEGLARRLTMLDQELVRLIVKDQGLRTLPASERVGELEQLRTKLFQEWAF